MTIICICKTADKCFLLYSKFISMQFFFVPVMCERIKPKSLHLTQRKFLIEPSTNLANPLKFDLLKRAFIFILQAKF